MSDITNLFNNVAPTSDGEPLAETVEADLARGRVALVREHRKRTIRRSMMASTTLVAGVAVVVVATQLGGSGAAHPAVKGGVHHDVRPAPKAVVLPPPKAVQKVHHHHTSAPKIKLVDYTGQQLQGFTVDKVPAGWRLSTSTQFALLIDPKGDKDNDPDAFVGKLAVLTQSADVHHLPKGDPVTVNGEDGTVAQQGKYGESLAYNTPNGIGVVIQAPPALGWGDSQIVAFAEGVHMTGNALASHG